MADIWLECHERNIGLLRHVQLARGNSVGGRDGSVVVEHPVCVDLCVDVDRTPGVEAGIDTLHLHDSLGVCGPHAAEEGGGVGVQVGYADLEVGDVELVEEHGEGGVWGELGEAGVRAGGVAVPEIDKDVVEWFAGRHVEDSHVDGRRNVSLAVQKSGDVERTRGIPA